MPTNAHGQGYSDLNYLIPELVQRIDYRKGPYFSENGDFSAAGSADIRYRNSLDHNIANLTLGSFGYQRMLLAGSTALTLPGQGAAGTGPILLGALEIMRNNGPWAVREDMQKTSALVRLADGNRASGWSIDAVYYDARWNSTDQVPLALINAGQLGRFSALDPSDGGNTGRQIISGEWHNTDAGGYARVSAYLQHYRLQLWSNLTYFELRPATGDQFAQAENRTVLGGQAVKGWAHSLLGHDSITEMGLQLRHDNIDVGLQDTQARVPFATVSSDRVGESSAGLYLQNITTWTPWLRTLAGLRDKFYMNLASSVLPQNSGSASGSRLSPKLSVILGPWAKTELFANAGRGFHSNDARGVIDRIDPTTGGPATAVPALVGSTGKEIGARTEWIKGLQSSVALWRLDNQSELVSTPIRTSAALRRTAPASATASNGTTTGLPIPGC